MTERYDAILVHSYMSPYNPDRPALSLRGYMQMAAASSLYREGRADKIIMGIGHVWGKEKPTLSEVMKENLTKRSVDPIDIVTPDDIAGVPEAADVLDTKGEVELFLDLAKKNGWGKVASLANRKHLRRVALYQQAGVDLISTEDVLRAEYNRPHYVRFLEKFARSSAEKKFGVREAIVRTLSRLGLDNFLSRAAKSPTVQKLKLPFDR